MAARGLILVIAVVFDIASGKNVKVSWKECNLDPGLRLDCGYRDISEEKCYQRGCCWAEEKSADTPWCYHSIKTTTPQCMSVHDERVACGSYGVKKHHCLAQDCCWQPTNDYTTPWCYHTTQVPLQPDECGTPAIAPQFDSGRIVGGDEARPHSWPWQVSLQMGGSHFCGASIVNENWVVSAAHCEGAWLYGDNVDVVVGLHSQWDPESTSQRIGTVRTIPHESYDYDEGTNNLADDIMLIELEEPIRFNEHVSPICIPDQGEESFEAGMRCYATGWGTVRLHGDTPDKLQQVSVPIVKQETCVDWYADPQNWYDESGNAPPVTGEMICAGFEEGGRGTCHGDSGGPMVCRIGDKWKLAGVVSWGGPCAHERTPSVFARVSQYRDWMEQHISSHK